MQIPITNKDFDDDKSTDKTIKITVCRNNSIFVSDIYGKSARKWFGLDYLEKSSGKVNILIPEGTTSINTSFLIGMLGKSVEKLGMKGFEDKYNFLFEDTNDIIVKKLEADIEDGKRHLSNIRVSWFQKLMRQFNLY
jgi:hypothetical protein